MKRKMFSKIVVFAIVTMSVLSSYAGDRDPPARVNTPGSDNNNPHAHPPHTDAPFDAGLAVLLAAGISYGIKKRYDWKKKTAQSSL